MFHRRGFFVIDRAAMDEEKLMALALELGADDVAVEEGSYEIYTLSEAYTATLEELERRGVPLAAKELAMIPQTQVEVPPDRLNQVLRLVEALEDHDDVQHVWGNLDIDDKVLAAQSH
jgi:transcriptional/translational regulatory protein YebC/TACO1